MDAWNKGMTSSVMSAQGSGSLEAAEYLVRGMERARLMFLPLLLGPSDPLAVSNQGEVVYVEYFSHGAVSSP